MGSHLGELVDGRRAGFVGGVVEDPAHVESGVVDGEVEIVEQVVLVGEAVEGADGQQGPSVFGASTLEQHGDAPSFELGDDLAEGLGAGGVEHLDVGRRRMTTLTSATAVSSVRNRCEAPKNRAPSSR